MNLKKIKNNRKNGYTCQVSLDQNPLILCSLEFEVGKDKNILKSYQDLGFQCELIEK